MAYRLAADGVLLVHWLFVLFLVLGLILVLLGGWRGWPWVQQPLFRWLHLSGILVVVVQAWLGLVCPLTSLEMALRRAAGDTSYSGAFIAHWLQELLYVQAPLWLLGLVYSSFGLLVVLAWWWLPPRKIPHRPSRRKPRRMPHGPPPGSGP